MARTMATTVAMDKAMAELNKTLIIICNSRLKCPI